MFADIEGMKTHLASNPNDTVIASILADAFEDVGNIEQATILRDWLDSLLEEATRPTCAVGETVRIRSGKPDRIGKKGRISQVGSYKGLSEQRKGVLPLLPFLTYFVEWDDPAVIAERLEKQQQAKELGHIYIQVKNRYTNGSWMLGKDLLVI